MPTEGPTKKPRYLVRGPLDRFLETQCAGRERYSVSISAKQSRSTRVITTILATGTPTLNRTMRLVSAAPSFSTSRNATRRICNVHGRFRE
jgi:hypothetical protein